MLKPPHPSVGKRPRFLYETTTWETHTSINLTALTPLESSVYFSNQSQGLADAVEHRHGKQRVPFVSGGIGSSVCVNDITAEELKGAIDELWAMHGTTMMGIAKHIIA